MYDTLVVKNITDLALALKDLYDENRELRVKNDNYRREITSLNDKIRSLTNEIQSKDKIIDDIRANIEAHLEECI